MTPRSRRLRITLILTLLATPLGLPGLGAQTPSTGSPSAVGVVTSALRTMPEAIASFGASHHRGALYVLGGHVGRAHVHSRENLSARFLRQPAGTDAWEELEGGVALQSVALVSCGPHLYRIGGMSARNAPGEDEDLHSVREAARYAPEDGAWEAFAPLPAGRSSHDAIASGDRIVVVGGWTLGGETRVWCDEALICDVAAEAPSWRAVAQPFRRRALAAAHWRGHVYAIGGIDEAGRPSSDVHVLDLESETWREGPALPSPGFGAAALGTAHGLFVSLLDGSILRLSDAGDTWEAVGSLLFPRFFHRLVAAGPDQLDFVGGAGRIGHLATIERADIGSRTSPAVVTVRRPWPGASRNRQAVVLDGGVLRFFGGNTGLDQHGFAPERFTGAALALDLATLSITGMRDLPVNRQSQRATIAASKDGRAALVLGGFGHDGRAARSHADVFSYDLNTEECRLTGRLPRPLTQFGMTAWEDRLWIFGGLDYDPDRGREDAFHHSDDIFTASLAGSTPSSFETTPWKLPVPRRAFGGARLGDAYYLAGGMTDDFAVVSSFLAFDLQEKTWRALPEPTPRVSPQLVACGEKLYLVGGSSPGAEGAGLEPSASVEVFDPRTEQWRVLIERLPSTPRHVRAFALQGRLFVVSTHFDEGVLEMIVINPKA